MIIKITSLNPYYLDHHKTTHMYKEIQKIKTIELNVRT